MGTKIKILADFHHLALYYSLHLLFEKRFNYELYRPIGIDWYKSGYWKISDLCVTDQQLEEKLDELLIENAIPKKSTSSWNKVLEEHENFKVIDGYGGCPVEQKGITFQQLKNHKFDLLVSTFVWNIPAFRVLRDKYFPEAKVVAQFGNNWNLSKYEKEYILASIAETKYTSDKVLFYRQEFDTSLYSPSNKNPKNILTSFVCFNDITERDKTVISSLERELYPKYKTNLCGINAPGGFLEDQQEIASLMKQSKFGIHLKSVGDGYGHTLHQWFAVGRPVIYRGSYYKNTLGEKLLHHTQTGFDLDKMRLSELINIIETINENDYKKLCSNVSEVFNRNVDFEKDAINVLGFLTKILERNVL